MSSLTIQQCCSFVFHFLDKQIPKHFILLILLLIVFLIFFPDSLLLVYKNAIDLFTGFVSFYLV